MNATTDKHQDELLIQGIAMALVAQPDAVQVERTVDEMGVCLRVKVGDGDAGRLIGKDGSLIRAIRTVINAVGKKHNARVSVKLDVPPAPNKAEEAK